MNFTKTLAGLVVAVMASTTNADVARDVQCSSVYSNAAVEVAYVEGVTKKERELLVTIGKALKRRALLGLRSEGIGSAQAAVMLERFMESYDALYDEHMAGEPDVLLHFLNDCQPEAEEVIGAML